MFESSKGISLIIMILSVIFIMIIGLFVYQEFFSSKGGEENINFSRTGNLINNNPGFENNIWYLSYETPGAPANSVKLSFDEESFCKNGNNSCFNLSVGARVEVKGIEKGGNVLVKELEVLEIVN